VFEADLQARELRKAGRRLRVQEQPFSVLVALIARAGAIVKVFYPVFPPDRNAGDVLAWLTSAPPT